MFRDRAPNALTSAGDAPALALVLVSTSPATVIVDTSTPPASPSAGARQHSAEIPREEGQPRKGPRVEAPSSLSAELSSIAATSQSTGLAHWRLDLEVETGRPLTMEDRVASSP